MSRAWPAVKGVSSKDTPGWAGSITEPFGPLSHHKSSELQTWKLTSPQAQPQASSRFTDGQSRGSDLAKVAGGGGGVETGLFLSPPPDSPLPHPHPHPRAAVYPCFQAQSQAGRFFSAPLSNLQRSRSGPEGPCRLNSLCIPGDRTIALDHYTMCATNRPHPGGGGHSSWKSMVTSSTTPLRSSGFVV